MNHSVNVQRSPSQSRVTPPRNTARLPLSPNNRPHVRRHLIPLCRPQQDNVAPQAQPLAQANARLIHERLQQNHHRLQVQLHARPPSTSPIPAGPVKVFLDTTFRAYASRIQTEFTSLRAACARAVQREQHQTAEMRSTCARLARERDVAQEKLRVLLDRRAAPRVDTGKRTRAQVEEEDADAELEALGLQYPLSPVSPPQLPTQSPPPRLLSPFVLAARRSPAHTPDPEHRTAFDLTITCDSLSRPSKKRRVSDSSEDTLVGTPEAVATKTQERETCPPAGLGECDMDLESESESDSDFGSEAAISAGLKSRSVSRATSAAPPATSTVAALSVEQRPTPPPSASLPKAHLHLEYVDIMYVPTDGKLVCRVCLLAAQTAANGKRHPAIQAFAPSASWDVLRSHCEEAHPEACHDVVGLGQAGVRELRRRLGLGRGA